MGLLSTESEDPASRSPWVTRDGVVPDRQLHPLRSLPPFASPFAVDTGYPAPPAVALLGLRPSSDHASQASEPPTHPDPKARTRAAARRRKRRDPGDQQPPEPGET